MCSSAPYRWSEDTDANSSQSRLESLAIRRCSIRHIVDGAWTAWAHHIRTAHQERHELLVPALRKPSGKLRRHGRKKGEMAGTKEVVPAVRKQPGEFRCHGRKQGEVAGTKKSTCWSACWDQGLSTEAPKFDHNKYVAISNQWRDLLTLDSVKAPELEELNSRSHWFVVWMSVMSRHCKNKNEIWGNRLTIHIRSGRPCTQRTVELWVAANITTGGQIKLWDGSDLIEHAIPTCAESNFKIHYWWDTGSDPHTPWQQRPATYWSTWGNEVRPLVSNPYACAQGDRAIRECVTAPPTPIPCSNLKVSNDVSHQHCMGKKSGSIFGSNAIDQFMKGGVGTGIMFVGYAIGNVGLVLVAK